METSKKLFFGFLFLFGFVEFLLRFFQPSALAYYRNIKLLHRYHPDYYVTLGKNLNIYIKHHQGLWEGKFTTNSLGFRGSPEPDPNLLKIACLGDSLVMGFGVGDEDTFCYQLNGFQWKDKTFQSMNLAVDAYGSLGSAKRLKESLEKLHFDLVLFFVSPNDFTVPPGLQEQGVLADDIVEKQRENDSAYRAYFFWQFELTRYSYFLHALKLAWEQLQLKRIFLFQDLQTEWEEWKSPVQYLSKSFYTFPPKECPPKVPNQNIQPTCPEPVLESTPCTVNIPKPTELPPLPDETIYAYKILLNSIRESNSRLIVVFIPMQNEDIRCYNSGLHSPLYEYALRAKAFFQSEGIPVIELMDYANEICPISEFFIPGDGHLTVYGNHWVAEKLKKQLEKYLQREDDFAF